MDNILPTLSLTIHSGYSLPKADLLSSIDAYCVLYVPLLGGTSEIHKTRVINDKANPKWNVSMFRIDVDTSRDLLIEVWDEDNLKDEIVCKVNVPLPKLMFDRVWNKQKFVLECLGKHKPYKGASECGLCISAFVVSLADIASKVPTPFVVVDNSSLKRILVYPLKGVASDSLFVKISAARSLKVSILDTSPTRNLVLFEVFGRNVASKIIAHEKPKSKFSIMYYRKIKLEKFDPHALSNLKLLFSPLSMVETKSVNTIAADHGWTYAMPFDQAKQTLKNITVDEEKRRIFMNEANYAFMVDFDSGKKKIWLKEESASKGYHAEYIYKQRKGFVVTSHQEPNVHKQTGTLFRFSSQVKDSPFYTPLKEFTIDLYQRISTQEVVLSGTYLPIF